MKFPVSTFTENATLGILPRQYLFMKMQLETGTNAEAERAERAVATSQLNQGPPNRPRIPGMYKRAC